MAMSLEMLKLANDANAGIYMTSILYALHLRFELVYDGKNHLNDLHDFKMPLNHY